MDRHARDLLTPDEEAGLVKAIQDAERRTSGEIKVHLEDHCPRAAIRRAEELFRTLGLAETRARSGVLIYLAVRDKKFAIVGDEGIDTEVPPGFWDDIRDGMGERFRDGRFYDGIRFGVERTGEALGKYLPWHPDDVNELSDEISFGDR